MLWKILSQVLQIRLQIILILLLLALLKRLQVVIVRPTTINHYSNPPYYPYPPAYVPHGNFWYGSYNSNIGYTRGDCPSNNYQLYLNPPYYPYPRAYVPHGNFSYNACGNVNIRPKAQKNPDVNVGNLSQKYRGVKIGSIGGNIGNWGGKQVVVGNIGSIGSNTGYQGGQERVKIGSIGSNIGNRGGKQVVGVEVGNIG